MISRKFIGPVVRPIRFSQTRLRISSTLVLEFLANPRQYITEIYNDREHLLRGVHRHRHHSSWTFGTPEKRCSSANATASVNVCESDTRVPSPGSIRAR